MLNPLNDIKIEKEHQFILELHDIVTPQSPVDYKISVSIRNQLDHHILEDSNVAIPPRKEENRMDYTQLIL